MVRVSLRDGLHSYRVVLGEYVLEERNWKETEDIKIRSIFQSGKVRVVLFGL